MSDKVTFKWRNSEFYNLRRDPAVIRELERRGRQIAAAANKTLAENSIRSRVRNRRFERVGYRMSSFQGRKVKQGRWFVQVYTASHHAKHSEAKNNTLVRVLNETQGINATQLREYEP